MNEQKLIITNYKDGILTFTISHNQFQSISFTRKDEQEQIGDIYVAKVTNVVNNIQAAFISYAEHKTGFLPIGQISNPVLLNRSYDGRILCGDEILVQLEKEAIRTKEPVFTTNLSIAGKYCVLSSGKRSMSISSKISKPDKELLSAFLPNEHPYGIVVRTNASTLLKTKETNLITEEIDELTKTLDTIISNGIHRTCYTKIYQEMPEYIKLLQSDANLAQKTIITDDRDIYDTVYGYLQQHQTSLLNNLSLYEDQDFSLSKLYAVDTKVQELLSKKVWLKSGAYLVIEQTEAMYVIDVNSGKNIVKKGKDDIAFQINLEAAREIMRQINLRNLSGIIMVDFINMEQPEMVNELMKVLQELANKDPIKTIIVDITSLGLVEITRKKTKKSLKQQMCVDI